MIEGVSVPESPLEVLIPQRHEGNRFRATAPCPPAQSRVFGGNLIALMVNAASAVHPGRVLRSAQAHFLAPVAPEEELELAVHTVRAGRRSATVAVDVTGGRSRAVTAMLNLGAEEESDGLMAETIGRGVTIDDPADHRADVPLELDTSSIDQWFSFKRAHGETDHPMWVRAKAPVNRESAVVPEAILAALTDIGLVRVAWLAARPTEAAHSLPAGTSAQHSVWIHSATIPDDWLLLRAAAFAGNPHRVLVRATLEARAGDLLATAVQEVRLRTSLNSTTGIDPSAG
ncbi:acyl-CoA thioesterase II [Sporichthya brevicatena]|uniref:Acyl-CoA thioesterase II n=1 Tax=Sporichthya brevicatena TaxID=171442 RepID=A0ABP3RQY1_9ACTN